MDGQIAATRIATLLACKGGRIDEITVGDCVELVDTQRRVQARGGQKKVDFYLRLRALGIFPPDAPATIRAFGLAGGQLSIEELVDRYRLRCTPVRDLIVDYLRERQPALDYASLDAICRTLAGLFWAKIETSGAGHRHLRLPPQIARTVEGRSGDQDAHHHHRRTGDAVELTSPRLNATDELLRVRAFYLDIAQWAVEEPDPLGTLGGALPDQRTPRSAAPRCASTASPAWISAPASGSRSCPCWCAPPTSGDSRPHTACTPPPAPHPARSSPTPTGPCAARSWPPTRSTAAASGRRTPSPAGGAT